MREVRFVSIPARYLLALATIAPRNATERAIKDWAQQACRGTGLENRLTALINRIADGNKRRGGTRG